MILFLLEITRWETDIISLIVVLIINTFFLILYQPSCPQSSVSPDAPAAVSSVPLADSMGKSFPQNDVLMKVITMAGSNYYYASRLIAGQLLDILRFPQVFTLLSSNLLKAWNNKQLLKEAVQDFIETDAAVNPLARIFIGSITPCPGVKQQTLDGLKEFNWVTRKKIAKLAKKGFAVEYINVHNLFLNEDGFFKAIACWYTPDNYHMSNYRTYFIHKQFLEASGLISKLS